MCHKAPKGSLLRGIDPYGDTMFNVIQLDQLIEEIDSMAVDLPIEREALSTLRAAADTAIRKRGYLYFVGD